MANKYLVPGIPYIHICVYPSRDAKCGTVVPWKVDRSDWSGLVGDTHGGKVAWVAFPYSPESATNSRGNLGVALSTGLDGSGRTLVVVRRCELGNRTWHPQLAT